MCTVKLIIFLILAIPKLVSPSNILAVTTLGSPSHHLFNDAFLFELANRGYNVTILGHDEDKHQHPNYTHIVMKGMYEKLRNHVDLIALRQFTPPESIVSLNVVTSLMCEWDLETEGLRQLLRYPDNFKFDLIIWDINAGLCLFPLVEKFGRPPIVGITAFIMQPNIFGNVYQSYIPFYLRDYTDHMTFLQRLENNLWLLFSEYYRRSYFCPKQARLATEYFGETELTADEFERNISLVLANYHPVVNYPEALPPNVIPVGGLQIKSKRLPDQLQQILDSAESGAILFSLGTNVRSMDFGREKIANILDVFARLKQTVIWKFEDDSLGMISKNLHVLKWVPQSDILQHPNTVLFITHGGLLSSHEAVHAGVPIIGIPFYLDQISNVGNLAAKGMGEKFNFDDLGTNRFHEMIDQILNNKSYRMRAKQLSKLYKDQPMRAMDLAVFWTEYVLRHGTGKHFNLPVRNMNLFQMLNLDLFIALLLIIVVAIFIISAIIILVWRFLRKKKLNNTKNKLQ